MAAKFDPQHHHRKSIRLSGYDYAQAGAYFVTIVTWQRDCLFGEVVDGVMICSQAGKIVEWEWQNLASSFRFLELGASQVMPNHFHGILLFHDAGATRPGLAGSIAGKSPAQNESLSSPDGSPLRNGSSLPHGPKMASLGAVIGQFKSRVTKRLWKMPELNGTPIWQRNYHDRIIRNDHEMGNIWRYIESNPLNWADDTENPLLVTCS